MRLCVLASGSSGNALVMEHEGQVVLADCGIGYTTLSQRLAPLGLSAAAISHLVLTHEHSDHVSHALALIKRHPTIKLWASAGTLKALGPKLPPQVGRLQSGLVQPLGAFQIEPVAVAHDTLEPLQYVFATTGHRLGLLTDLGHASEEVLAHYRQLDAWVLEANHDADMLRRGPYPAALKARVGGDVGHLSNAQAAALLAQCGSARLQWLCAAHLSAHNNRPEHVKAAFAPHVRPTTTFVIASKEGTGTWTCLN